MRVERTRYPVPGWGAGELWTSPERVLAHHFDFDGAPGGRDEEVAGTDGAPAARGETVEAARLVRRFEAFFAGDAVRLDEVPLDLEWCTPFQLAVAETLRRVPRGHVVTYGELAALAGHPGTQRAVGTFCAHNRFMVLLPCHRVVAAGGIGGYGPAGVGVKRRLLALEGVVL